MTILDHYRADRAEAKRPADLGRIWRAYATCLSEEMRERGQLSSVVKSRSDKRCPHRHRPFWRSISLDDLRTLEEALRLDA